MYIFAYVQNAYIYKHLRIHTHTHTYTHIYVPLILILSVSHSLSLFIYTCRLVGILKVLQHTITRLFAAFATTSSATPLISTATAANDTEAMETHKVMSGLQLEILSIQVALRKAVVKNICFMYIEYMFYVLAYMCTCMNVSMCVCVCVCVCVFVCGCV